MLIVSIFLILAILSFRSESKIVDEIIVIIVLCFVSIIFTYRASDYPIYHDYFLAVEPLYRVIFGEHKVFSHDIRNYELGYRIINSFLRIFTNHIEFLYIFCNAYILYAVYKLFVAKSFNMFKLLMPYFIFMLITVQVGIIRQMIAISIFFFSIQFIQKREFFKFLACTFLAFCFHRTAIVLPVFYFITYKEYSNKLLLGLLLVGILVFLEIIPFHPVRIVEWLNGYIKIEAVHAKLDFYIWQTRTLPVHAKFTRGIFENTGMFLLLLFIKFDLNKKQLYDRFINICLNLALIYILIYIYFFDISSFSYRLNYYLIIFKFFVLVRYIESLEITSNKIIANTLLIIYCAMMMVIRIGQGF
jgi:hypothetical protein